MLQTILNVGFHRLRGWLAQGRLSEGIHSAAQTRKVLERERTRADRTQTPVSVITFLVDGKDVQPATAVWLVKILRSRLRSLDETGWLDDVRICAILPATPPQGAWKVLEDVNRNFPANIPPPCSVVYAYPEDFAGSTCSSRADGMAAPLSGLLAQPLPVWKRALDISVAVLGLALLVPLFAAIAAAIKLLSPGPVFFLQRRSGLGGRPFLIYKFRTMIADAEARKSELLVHNESDGPAFKIKQDPRVTRLGRLLRTTSLDELPQLWNVLRGEMSLVGPRPLPCHESDACLGWQRQRLDMMPGLTCIWQIEGRGRVSFAEWVRMDVRYIRSLSPWFDLKLLLLTIPAVVLRRGAH